jgi:hypothetical protein
MICHQVSSWSRLSRSTSLNIHISNISWNIVFPLQLGLSWGLFPLDVALQLFVATCPAYLIFYDLIILIIFGGWYKIMNILTWRTFKHQISFSLCVCVCVCVHFFFWSICLLLLWQFFPKKITWHNMHIYYNSSVIMHMCMFCVCSLWIGISPLAGHSGDLQYSLKMREEKALLVMLMYRSTSKTLMTMHPFSLKEFILEMLQKMAQQVLYNCIIILSLKFVHCTLLARF